MAVGEYSVPLQEIAHSLREAGRDEDARLLLEVEKRLRLLEDFAEVVKRETSNLMERMP